MTDDIPLAEGLSCTLDSTKEHPEQFLTILGGEKPFPLSKVQALALFKLMLSSLDQIAEEEVLDDPLLSQVNLVQAFHDSMEWLEEQDQTGLEEEEALKEAYEQYQNTCDLQEEMLEAVQGWEALLDGQSDKLEAAAEELGISLDELNEEDAYELDDERPERPDAT